MRLTFRGGVRAGNVNLGASCPSVLFQAVDLDEAVRLGKRRDLKTE